jgi:hypothetical protein
MILDYLRDELARISSFSLVLGVHLILAHLSQKR